MIDPEQLIELANKEIEELRKVICLDHRIMREFINKIIDYFDSWKGVEITEDDVVTIRKLMREALDDVSKYDLGTDFDHLLSLRTDLLESNEIEDVIKSIKDGKFV